MGKEVYRKVAKSAKIFIHEGTRMAMGNVLFSFIRALSWINFPPCFRAFARELF